MTTWITTFDPPAAGLDGKVRVAVKDAIDMAGVITTAGSGTVRDRATPATKDAPCLAGIRAAADVHIVGKTNLTELCLSPVGINPTFGTPVNPAAPDRIPGGSSSGSAVAVAAGEADVALGTDTGGSVRIPAACCNIVGLKTTWGRVPTTGVWPLAPSLDTVGPLARDVAGVIAGMGLLEPGFTVAGHKAQRIGRLRIDGVDQAIEDAVDEALDAAGLSVREVRLPGWDAAHDTFGTIVVGEFWRAHPTLLDAEGVDAFVNGALHAGRDVTDDELAEAMAARASWQSEVAAVFDEVDVLALPTLVAPPPSLTGFAGFPLTQLTAPFNLAGVPALSMPMKAPGSLQLVGPVHGEALICATGLTMEKS